MSEKIHGLECPLDILFPTPLKLDFNLQERHPSRKSSFDTFLKLKLVLWSSYSWLQQ